jgi:hypothetical protein
MAMVLVDFGFNGTASFSSFPWWDTYHLVVVFAAYTFLGDFSEGQGH